MEKNEIIEKLAQIAFYLGSEVDKSNAPIVADFIDTLYQAREMIKE